MQNLRVMVAAETSRIDGSRVGRVPESEPREHRDVFLSAVGIAALVVWFSPFVMLYLPVIMIYLIVKTARKITAVFHVMVHKVEPVDEGNRIGGLLYFKRSLVGAQP
jgi:hypothetical protein